MSDDLWGGFDAEDWSSLRYIAGRVADEDDVLAGRAVFYLGNPAEIGAKPYPTYLPHCAILNDEETGESTPVVVIQAEQAEERIYLGYRFLTGGNGICTVAEVEFLDSPDDRFTNR